MRNILLWITAFILTILFAYYQRVTGPTYPKNIDVVKNKTKITGRLIRSGYSDKDQEISLKINPPNVNVFLRYKRFKTHDRFTRIPMQSEGDKFSAFLPKQPPAGKLEYYIEIVSDSSRIIAPEEHVVIRFKGRIPLWILILHVIAMFAALLLSIRTGLEYFAEKPKVLPLLKWTLSILAVGGLILGPVVQYYAFGAFWTGFPFGHDLTDNKTVIALLGWLWAYYKIKKGASQRKWALIGSLILIAVYLIPHSVLGSELKYKDTDSTKTAVHKVIENKK